MLNNNLLLKLVNLSKKAGDAILDIYTDNASVLTLKEDDSPLTKADLVSNQIISIGIDELDLGWPILSEESDHITYRDRQEWSRFWLIDPLDGTREFIKRNGEFTVNIALIENGQPILGVVHAPALKVSYFATRGVGSFVQRHDLITPICAQPRKPEEVIKVVISRSHSDERTLRLLDHLGEYQCIKMGSSLKLCLVAEGLAHFYPRLGLTMEWDTAAAHAVLNTAGGLVCNHQGNELGYNKPNLNNPGFFAYSSRDKKLAKLIKELNDE